MWKKKVTSKVWATSFHPSLSLLPPLQPISVTSRTASPITPRVRADFRLLFFHIAKRFWFFQLPWTLCRLLCVVARLFRHRDLVTALPYSDQKTPSTNLPPLVATIPPERRSGHCHFLRLRKIKVLLSPCPASIPDTAPLFLVQGRGPPQDRTDQPSTTRRTCKTPRKKASSPSQTCPRDTCDFD